MKGRRVFVIPGRLRDGDTSLGMKRPPKEGDQAVETKKQGCRAVNGQIRPLALCFDAQVSPALLKGRLQTPPVHKRAHDLLGSQSLVRRKQGFGGSLPLGITGEDPANGQGRKACAIPQRGPATDLQRAFALPVPVQTQTLPRRVRVGQDLFKRWEARTHHPRTTNGVRVTFRRQLIEGCIQMKRGEQAHLLLLALQAQFQNTVSGIAQQRDRQGGKPAAHQLDHLARPHPGGLVTLAQARTHGRRVVASTHRNGKAQRCLVQGSVTTTAMIIQRSPGLLTERLRLESALSQ